MNISFVKSDYDNGCNFNCRKCSYYESGDLEVGIASGCTHPILYDKDYNIIDEINDLIIEAMDNPRRCILAKR